MLDLINALQGVVDNESGQNLLELGMVRNIRIANGQVEMTIALNTGRLYYKDKLVASIKKNVGSLPGIADVHVTTTMRLDR